MGAMRATVDALEERIGSLRSSLREGGITASHSEDSGKRSSLWGLHTLLPSGLDSRRRLVSSAANRPQLIPFKQFRDHSVPGNLTQMLAIDLSANAKEGENHKDMNDKRLGIARASANLPSCESDYVSSCQNNKHERSPTPPPSIEGAVQIPIHRDSH